MSVALGWTLHVVVPYVGAQPAWPAWARAWHGLSCTPYVVVGCMVGCTVGCMVAN